MTALFAHWQDVVTLLTLIAAVGYLGRRSLRRARAGDDGGACATCPGNAARASGGGGAPRAVSGPPCAGRGIPPPA
jgi:hypothetical protein